MTVAPSYQVNSAIVDQELQQYMQGVNGRSAKPLPSIPEFHDRGSMLAMNDDSQRSPFDFEIHADRSKQEAKIQSTDREHKRISLNFQDVNVGSVLQLIAEFTEKNIILSNAVEGKITLRLHDVPWEEALDAILTLEGLAKRTMGNVILIDKASVLAERSNSMLKERLSTQQLRPLHSVLLQIKYAKAMDIAEMLKNGTSSLLSERGAINVDVRTNTIWLKDTLAQVHVIKDLVRRLDIPTKQVVIEARIVNINKHCAEDLGVRLGVSQLSMLSGTLDGANQAAQGVLPANIPISNRLNLDLGAIPLDANPASIGIALAKLNNHTVLDLELSALESEGRAKVVASPRLVTTNQQAAVIESGEDIPYQEAMESGATSVAFKRVVLRLKVTPQITSDGKLLMDLIINQDSDSGRRVQGVPIILTKAIQTNVLVNDGQTIVLGGIYKKDKNNVVIRVPFLGSLPGIGYLFRRTQAVSRNEELLIFITPKIL